ncbi:unknown [Candidatus Colimorpha enterica]|uniref:Uncharacterized protein n=1 Tax=Candidatus Colimorpha enterica TaxID=3083063 RepID=R6TDQ3_9BACT|nr:unknown [Candidatus Colimorpha enterica]
MTLHHGGVSDRNRHAESAYRIKLVFHKLRHAGFQNDDSLAAGADDVSDRLTLDSQPHKCAEAVAMGKIGAVKVEAVDLGGRKGYPGKRRRIGYIVLRKVVRQEYRTFSFSSVAAAEKDVVMYSG